jgi:hypothetical protein
MDPQGLLHSEALESAPPRELLATYELILSELRRREIVRTNDAPAGQYAEWLAHRVFGGELAANAAKSYDLLTPSFGKVQVKARVLRNGSAGERQLSPFRSFDFDYALVILFDRSYAVHRAALLLAKVIIDNSVEKKHVNGRIVFAREPLLEQGIDVTELMNVGGPQS